MDQLWLDLTTSGVGFYTSDNASTIPSTPGVYAWYYPLKLKFLDKGGIREFLSQIKRMQAFDAKRESNSPMESTFNFTWDPLSVSVGRKFNNPQIETHIPDIWSEISKSTDDIIRSTKIAALAGTLFTRPLYIGLSDNLSRRYGDHTLGRTGFHDRFKKYMGELGMPNRVSDLLFVCISIDKEGKSAITREKQKAQIDLIEGILKVLGQPIFSKI